MRVITYVVRKRPHSKGSHTDTLLPPHSTLGHYNLSSNTLVFSPGVILSLIANNVLTTVFKMYCFQQTVTSPLTSKHSVVTETIQER